MIKSNENDPVSLRSGRDQARSALDGKRSPSRVVGIGAGGRPGRTRTPEVAIVDLGLPVLDGLEVARQLRQNPRYRDTYLIALTGYGQRADRENALEAGFDEHLVKPVDTRELLRLLGVEQRAAR